MGQGVGWTVCNKYFSFKQEKTAFFCSRNPNQICAKVFFPHHAHTSTCMHTKVRACMRACTHTHHLDLIQKTKCTKRPLAMGTNYKKKQFRPNNDAVLLEIWLKGKISHRHLLHIKEQESPSILCRCLLRQTSQPRARAQSGTAGPDQSSGPNLNAELAAGSVEPRLESSAGNVDSCIECPKMSQNVHFRRIVVRTDLFELWLTTKRHHMMPIVFEKFCGSLPVSYASLLLFKATES